MNNKELLLPAAIVLSALIISGTILLRTSDTESSVDAAVLEQIVLPDSGITLPVRWGDLGRQLIETGVIDRQAFDALYVGRGGFTPDELALLDGTNNGAITMRSQNADVLLNLFWALGLGNESPILLEGLMVDERYGGAGNFASTGGWTLARGDAMTHYAMHPFIALTDDQRALVERVAKNIYRPCCNNPTHFPDCNHGMAMLGLLELMASQGAGENELYHTALQVNAYWFPDTYLTIAKYLVQQGKSWDSADPRELLGADFSSASGYRRILSEVEPAEGRGSSCGV